MTIAIPTSQTSTSVPYTKPTPANAASYKPTHPGLVKVVLQQGEQGADGEDTFSSFLVAERDLPANTVVTHLKNLTPGTKAYSSVQHGNGPDDHFELNSDLLFVNHSCTPNVAFDLSHPRSSEQSASATYPPEWHLRTLSRPVAKGEALTFFYPSTEWDMGAPFACACGESNCLGQIQGAKYLTLAQLKQQEWVNPYIMHRKVEESS
ncbi:hypothetical protein NCC49_004427 [Naganishia albida]|nr:hypothetical protein NCC49_004427 [Naganishia albida]